LFAFSKQEKKTYVKNKQAGQDTSADATSFCSRFCVLTMNCILHNEKKKKKENSTKITTKL
jgi:hypothetical protein